MKFEYDIIVVGGGHAGCEAAAAAANLGSPTLLISMDMGKYAQMSCNPAIGGVAKGQIVREIDALGGYMGIITDKTTIQFRMLNSSKGPAMWSPRAQCDKTQFTLAWRELLENLDNLYLWQDSVSGLLTSTENGQHKVCGVRTNLGVEFTAKSVILTSGTFLNGLMHVGVNSTEGGRSGDASSYGITENLADLGFEIGRMKTGTPVRIDGRKINFDIVEPQYGDEKPSKFSYLPNIKPVENQLPCYLVYTSSEVHNILKGGFDESPLFTGRIKGIGPRYCPSIEDKLKTFSEKDSHQLFLEPEGRNCNEYYLNGFSSSLPWNVQMEALSKIKGFEDIHIYRPGYAIEYDYFPPTQLYHTLETKLVSGLYFAGQINGTTGYEEAGAQGLMAGINAHQKNNGLDSVILRRDEAYIGVLIDDLVSKGVDEPYRMFTSRAEYRILLRQDNADIRLTPIGRKVGLVDDERFTAFSEKLNKIESLLAFIRTLSITATDVEKYLISVGTPPLTQGKKLHDVLLRNEVKLKGLVATLPQLSEFIENLGGINNEALEETEIQIKYKGYIERERMVADKILRLENIKLNNDFDYHSLNSLTIEARQKLTKIKPPTIGHASRIPGVSPADINVLLIFFGR